MAFLAETFLFNGEACDDYELVLASIDGGGDSSSAFASAPEISDAYLPRKWKPHFYGVTRPGKLTFELSCMLIPCRIDNEDYLTRTEIKDISRWLTSPDSYRWLVIRQPDMMNPGENPTALYRYRCMVTGLELIFVNDCPCGFKITVTCDSPYAYLPHFSSDVIAAVNAPQPARVNITNPATPERGVSPVITINISDEILDFGDDIGPITIKNVTTNETLTISTLPASVARLTIDCDKQVISADDGSNIYQYCNFVFPHLASGTNRMEFTVSGPNFPAEEDVSFTVECDFPVDIGA